ncbi:MAG: ABC transporter ATP-binding protein, partial [Candidatus Electrothrix sp. ATG1]|nr:ABC transporter ATP-binding protein [Candidatus Electrothrix sp. ATG1]
MLTIENLHISFSRYEHGLHRQQINGLNGVSLQVRPGTINLVAGASGAGKSLLLAAILGLLPANSSCQGSIRFKEKEYADPTPLRGREIGLIPQSAEGLDPLQRVGKQVRRAARLAGLSRRGAKKQTEAVFARYGLGRDVLRLYPFQLSGGMATRVLLSCATVGKAKLLLADEPTTGLDEENCLQVFSHLRQLADEGRAILLISHDLSGALPFADDVTILKDGTLMETMSAEAFRQGVCSDPYSLALYQALPENDFLSTENNIR